MQIFIPSMQRSHDVRTALDLAGAGLTPIMVVPKGEAKAYRAALPAVEVVEHPQGIGIARARQWIMDHASEAAAVMVDDDLSFHVRRTDDTTKFRQAKPADVRRMFNTLEKHLGKYAHASTIARQGGNRVTGDMFCSRPWHVFGFNVEKFRAAGVKYCAGLVQDDFDITLQLLRKGFPNIVMGGYAVNQHGGHGSPGGANTYRTLEVHNNSVMRLKERHSEFVRVRETDYKSGNGEWGQRFEVVISWKKAYKEGCDACS